MPGGDCRQISISQMIRAAIPVSGLLVISPSMRRPVAVKFCLPKFHLPFLAAGFQSGPEPSRARFVRRSEPLTARTALAPCR